MCGICGFTGKSNPAVLQKMTDSLFHRGPDEDGYYSDARVNLGIRRLSIIDVETGHQPVHNEDENVWAVFNGELYNFKELREDLRKRGHRFYTDHSDTELIVHLYEELGDDFMHRLNGMFAIALWDKKRERLHLIRDRMGVKPLFYTVIQGQILFGSEIKSILSNPNYSREINYEAVCHYFSFKNIPAPLSAFRGIYSLLPGEMIIFEKDEIHRKKWWKIKFDEKGGYKDEEIKSNILELLEDATKLRMRSDVPFGAYLSGGVDSSTIVALMTKVSNKQVKTFSLGYEDELKNKEADLYYARKVSNIFNTEHYEYIMSCNDLIDEISNVIGAFDQPFSGTISTYFLTKLIARYVKVALSGDAADELFGSYLSHRVAQPLYHYQRLYRKLKNGFLTEEEKGLFKSCDLDFLEELYQKSGGDDLKWRYQLSVFNDEDKNDLFSKDFKAELEGIRSFSLYENHFKNLTSKDPLNRILEAEWNFQLPDQMLAFADFLSMAHSVEIRSPFLDYRLVEFVATIPGDMKIKNGNVKDILKKTVEPLLPFGITQRPKEGFVLPIFDWMGDKLKGFIMNVLSEERLKKHHFINFEEVKRILDLHYLGHKNYAAKVWNLVMFQLWWEAYFR